MKLSLKVSINANVYIYIGGKRGEIIRKRIIGLYKGIIIYELKKWIKIRAMLRQY
jgi:hypothetical protein